MNQPNPNLDHSLHEVTLIAGHAAGDLVAPDQRRAEALLAACTECADLHRDLLAIAAATRKLPAPTAPGRDFRLTPAQAERLGRGSWLRALLGPLGAPRSAIRPVAAAFTSLGVAGLLVATVIPGLLGGTAGLAPERAVTSGSGTAAGATSGAGTVTPAFGPGGVPAPQVGAPTPNFDYNAPNHGSAAPVPASTGAKAAGGETSGPGEVAVGGSGSPVATGSLDDGPAPTLGPTPAAATQPNLLAIGSLALLAVGLVLFGLRFAGRRIR